jgi:hypothetical protein
VVNWFWRRSAGGEAPKLGSRSSDVGARKVDLAELTPPLVPFLGQAAYLQITLFENLGRAIADAPTADAKARLSHAASLSLDKHHGLVDEIVRGGNSPGAVMDPFVARVDEFQRRTSGADWPEKLLTCYITAGFLDEFYVRLAPGLPQDSANRIIELLSRDPDDDRISSLLSDAIAENPRLASRLALWGRRLVGDTMLVARSAIAASADRDQDEERLEPAFTELIAAHTRRMDRLGLTA